jgi:hypothetical protein
MTEQLYFNARKNDPFTSHAAAEQTGAKTTMMSTLLRAFLKAGERGLTAEQAAVACHYSMDQAHKRVSDLLRMEHIERNGDSRRGSSGRLQLVHVITRTGQQEVFNEWERKWG